MAWSCSRAVILSLVNPLDQANMTGFVLLAGSFVAMVRITQYLVSLEIKCFCSKPAAIFWATLQVGQVSRFASSPPTDCD
jgi:hypothetical protein